MSRKETLLQAAIELFAEKGYNGTSTSEIVEKAGVAQGTLFYHYKNKEVMLLTILENILTEYLHSMENIDVALLDGLEAVEALVRNSVHFRQTRSRELLVLMRDFPADLIKPGSQQMEFIVHFFFKLHELFKVNLEKGQKDGSIRSLCADRYAHLLLAMLTGMDRHIMLSPLPAPELTEEVVEFCLSALSCGDKSPVSPKRSS